MGTDGRRGNGDERLTRLIDRALEAMSTNRRRIDLKVNPGTAPAVELRGDSFPFGGDDLSRTLAWERLADALPGAVERARLESMHRGASESWAAPWSVYSTATTVAWLVHCSGGRGTPSWVDLQEALVRAAGIDGRIALRSATDTGSMTGSLRSRQLLAKIRPGPNTRYDSAGRTMTTTDQVPHTVAIAVASKPHNLADIVEMPWVRDWNVLVAEVAVDADGTVLALSEALVPLVPIPTAALRAVPAGGPDHAPWIVTAAEREALDAVDAEAHRSL